MVLVHLLPVPRSRLVQLDGGGNRAELKALTKRKHLAPGLVAYRDDRAVGWVSLAPREDYERLAYSKVLAPLDDTPVWSIVCFVVSRRSRPGRRGGAPRRGDRVRAGPRRDDPRGLPGRSRRATGSRRRTPTTARSRCSNAPASRSSSAASGTPPARSARSSGSTCSDVAGPRTTSSVAARTSSSVRVDTRSRGAGRLPDRLACRVHRSSKRGGASMMTKMLLLPMRCAHRRPGIREICAHLELDRRRQDRLPDEPEPWARSGPRLF